MTRRPNPRAISTSGVLFCLMLAQTAGALPRVIVQHPGGTPHGDRTRIPSRPEGRTAEPERTKPELRSFPHDLHSGPRPPTSFRPVSELLASGAAAPGAPAQTDTLRVAIFRIDFLQDSVGNASTGDGRFDLRVGISGIPVDPPPHNKTFYDAHAEALRRFYDVQSYGHLAIESTVFPADPDRAYSMSDIADYGPWELSQSEDVIAQAERFVADAVGVVDQSGDVDFGRFDAFVVIHAGADFQGDVNRDSPYDLPSFTLTLGDSLIVGGGTARVGRVLVLPETVNQDDRIAALNGVFAHEFGHILGLPDLYNIFTGIPQVGLWSLMDSGENIAATVFDPETDTEFVAEGIFPTSLDAWSKLQAFPSAIQLLAVGESWSGTQEAVQVNPVIPLVSIDGLEYFLIENRALDLDGTELPFVLQDSTTGVFLGPVDDPANPGAGGRYEYDAVLPGGGILIRHIDDNIVLAGLADGAGVNFNSRQRGVALEEADGILDLGIIFFGRLNQGTPEDPFYLGNNTLFSPETLPGSAANDGSYSGITIEVGGAPARIMSLQIQRALARDGWPVALRFDQQVQTHPEQIVFVDLSGDGLPELVFSNEIDVVGEPRPLRQIAAIHPNGSPFRLNGSTVFAAFTNQMLPGLAASDRFVLRGGESESTVVAAVERNGDVLLLNRRGESLLSISVGGFTPPVLWPRGSDPGWVLVGGFGELLGVEVPGTVAYRGQAQVAGNTVPVTAPTLIPSVGNGMGDVAALGFENGAVEWFSLNGDPAQLPAPVVFSTAPRFLLSGLVAMDTTTTPSLVVVTGDSITVLSPLGGRSHAWPLPTGWTVTRSPVLGDVDGDGRLEILLASEEGAVGALNGDGSFSLGWPRQVEGPVDDLKLVDLNSDGAVDVLALDGAGRFHGWDGGGVVLETFPRALGRFTIAGSGIADLDGDGRLTWAALTEGSAVITSRLAGAGAAPGEWLAPGRVAEGGNHQPEPGDVLSTEAPVLERPVLVYPNPARGKGVEIRFLLAVAETAELEVLDLRGRRVAGEGLDLRGGFKPGENAVRWNLEGVAPGLYFCRLQRSGPRGRRVDLARIMVVQ